MKPPPPPSQKEVKPAPVEAQSPKKEVLRPIPPASTVNTPTSPESRTTSTGGEGQTFTINHEQTAPRNIPSTPTNKPELPRDQIVEIRRNASTPSYQPKKIPQTPPVKKDTVNMPIPPFGKEVPIPTTTD